MPVLFGRPSLAYSAPPIATMCFTSHSVSTLLTMVGHMYKPSTAGKYGGLMRGYGAFAFQRLDQAGFFAANVSARTAVNVNLQIKSAAQNILPEKTVLLGLLDRLLQDLRAFRELTSNIDVGQSGIDREARDDHPFEQLMRILVDDLAVFECARLGLVGVANQINRFRLARPNESPFYAAGEPGAATSAQPRMFSPR